MRLFGKRPRTILLGLVTIVTCYFMMVNFMDLGEGAGHLASDIADDPNVHLFNLAQEKHDPGHKHHHKNEHVIPPVDLNEDQHVHNARVDEDKLRRRVNSEKKLAEEAELAEKKRKKQKQPVKDSDDDNKPEKENEVVVDVNIKKEEKKAGGSPRRFLAYDGGGFGTVSSHVTKCANNIEIEITASSERLKDTDFSYFHMNAPSSRLSAASPRNNKTRRHYVMVYTMESEVHSFGGDTWSRADFKMWYHLELSWPEPATYFDVRMHLRDLLAPVRVAFEEKENATPIVWVVSNCNAYNGRERFMKKLMTYVGVDSYGGCMKNKFSHPNEHMKGNVELYAKYKFVISIENSNCEDYVTEKLVHAVASGSIPIVAGRDGKPNYLKFMPKDSYINVYDYKTVEELAERIKAIAASKEEYAKYTRFKHNNRNYTSEGLKELSLAELIGEAKGVMKYEDEREFFDGIVDKEKSEDKLCKIGRYLNSNTPEQIEKDVEKRRANRPDSSLACLKRSNLANDFKVDA